MQPIVYDVAVSIDGYISGPDGDISQFAHEGPVVDAYRARLTTYTCAIMGRATYEFGYRFGLEPGANPYPWMRTLVFSSTLTLPPDSAVEIVRKDADAVLDRLQRDQPGPIYLCGGGLFAGRLLATGRIDRLRLKRAPIVLGSGATLFSGAAPGGGLTCLATEAYEDGYVLQEYAVAPRR